MKSITALLVGLVTATALYVTPAFAQDNSCNLEEIQESITLDDFLENEIAPIVVPFGTLPPEPTIVTDPIEHLAFRLRDHGYEVDGKDLVTVLRVMYLEGAGERDNKSDLAIAASIVNRYRFDQDHGTNHFGGEDGLIGVVTKPFQYTAFNEKLADFKQDSYAYEDGRLRITSKRVQDEKRVQELAAALFNIATGRVKDPTNGALYYKKKGTETSWGDGTLAFYLGDTPCHHEELTDIGIVGGHVLYGVNCK